MAARALTIALAVGLLAVCGGCGSGDGESTSTAASQATQPSTGGEKSIEQFGEESTGDDRAGVLSAFHDYFRALAEGDYPRACSHLAASVKSSLAQIAGGKPGQVACSVALPKLLAPGAAAAARQQADGEVSKARIQGGKAFVVYHAPGAKLYQLYLLREGGEWKATTVSGSILVPSL